MAPEGTVGVGQVVQVAQEAIVAQPPALREPPPHRGLTFSTRTAFSPRRRREYPSSLEDNAVLDRKTRPRRRRRRRQHDGAARRQRRNSACAPPRESSRSCSLSSSSPRSPRCPQQHLGSRRRRHHRRRHRSAPRSRSRHRLLRRRPPPRPSHPRCGSHRPIEDLLLAPGLRSPPDDCGEIPVAWRTTQSSIGKYVLGANRSRHSGPVRPAGPPSAQPACGRRMEAPRAKG